jgi:hypothetical protein
MRLNIAFAMAVISAAPLCAQDAREIVRKSVELDQVNWLRMKDYTWIAHETECNLDSKGAVKSEKKETWETLILYGRPHRRMLKLDKLAVKLENETPEQRQRRVTEYEKRREKDRDFLREVTDLYDFHLEGEQQVDGHAAWVISATPKPGYQPKRGDAKPLLKIRGKIWIDKAEYQWVRLEAETTDTISYGLFIARLNPGAKLVFEQTRVNDEIWLPKRESVSGSGRLGLLRKISMQQELVWSNYRKFQVESKVVATQ